MFEKITVVGAGNVGATAAQRIAEKNLARVVVMVDVAEGIPQGKALDQWQSGPVEGFDTRVLGANDYSLSAGSELFVVTAGIARKPGMSRDDLVKTNAGIVRSVGEQIRVVAPDAIVIVVSNPLDAMCYVMRQATGFPREPDHRHGRRPRHGALPDLPLRRARRVGGGHPGDGPRRARRHDGAAGLVHDRLRASRSRSCSGPTCSTRSSPVRAMAVRRSWRT